MEEMTKKTYPSIAQGFGVLGITVLGMIVFAPIMLLEKDYAFLLYYLFAMGLPLWVTYVIRKKKTRVVNFSFQSFDLKMLPLIIIAPIPLALGVVFPVASLIPMPEFMVEIFLSMGKDTQGIFGFLVIVVAAPILEELIFRGVILDGFLQKYSPAKAIIFSSILFGLVHLNPWQFVTGLFLGCFIGWVYCRTRSLWLPIIIHASNNLWAYSSGFFFDFTSEDKSNSLIDTYGGFFNTILVLLSSWIVLAACIYLLYRIFWQNQTIEAPYVQNVSHS